MPIDIPSLWLPPKPAIIRPADLIQKRSPEKATTPFCFFSPVAGGITAAPRVDQTSGSSAGLAIPTGVRQAGDILLYAAGGDRTSSGVSNSFSNPSGWTEIANFSGFSSQLRTGVSAKVSTGSESGTLTGISTSDSYHNVIVVLRPNAAVASLGAGASVNQQAATTVPSDQTVTASGGTPPLLVLAVYYSNVTISPRGFSPTKDDEYASSTVFYLAWKLYGSGTTPLDATISMEDEGYQLLGSCYTQLTLS